MTNDTETAAADAEVVAAQKKQVADMALVQLAASCVFAADQTADVRLIAIRDKAIEQLEGDGGSLILLRMLGSYQQVQSAPTSQSIRHQASTQTQQMTAMMQQRLMENMQKRLAGQSPKPTGEVEALLTQILEKVSQT